MSLSEKISDDLLLKYAIMALCQATSDDVGANVTVADMIHGLEDIISSATAGSVEEQFAEMLSEGKNLTI